MNMLTEGFQHFIGKEITGIAESDNVLVIDFSDNTYLRIYDNGQDCCEWRYMTCDDDFSSLYGQRLDRVVEKNVDIRDGDGDVHEVTFLEIGTNFGFITVEFHNEHNGYYGGFNIAMSGHHRTLH